MQDTANHYVDLPQVARHFFEGGRKIFFDLF